ncbi:hypothetical protein LWI29_029205 [Acer saccharum]|uniref:GED domain-containing protein n=1 Tax=Acer saccharum TaxID=4024 RepID=A0AA39S9M9_ACESA|nr:hypothetical protein LWI29_029205 [Acer saccharum]
MPAQDLQLAVPSQRSFSSSLDDQDDSHSICHQKVYILLVQSMLKSVGVLKLLFEYQLLYEDQQHCILSQFDNQLPAALKRLQFDKQLSIENIRKLITKANGYQPHLIAHEQGYRCLIDSSLVTIRGTTVLSYVNMVCVGLRNSIPKSIVYCQVREAKKKSLLDHFFIELGAMEPKRLSSLLNEDPAVMD